MTAIMYMYAIFCIGVCIGAAFMGLSAFSITRRRLLLYLSIFVLVYALEQTVVFFNEFITQNLPFQSEQFATMEDPVLRLVVGAALCQSLWLAFLTFFDERRPLLRLLPLALFLLLSIIVLIVPFEDEATRKWALYSLRTLFYLWDALFCVIRYLTCQSKTLRARYRSKAPLLAAFAALVLLVFVEDTVIMLVLDPQTVESSAILAYLYRRNTCESFLVLGVIVFTMHQSLRALRLKRDETTLPQTSERKAQAQDILPYFAKKHGLTPREQEILGYVVEGMDNQQISRKLQVSIGTVKTHTHHLFKKTGTGNREELLRAFWAEQ